MLDSDEEDGSNEDYFHTSEPYYTFQGEEFVQEEKDHVQEIMSHAEVPGICMNISIPHNQMKILK